MQRQDRSAPIWLFSFVDLAFLLLIAFTQVGLDPDPVTPDLATLEVPRIEGEGAPLSESESPAHWQLRVLPLPPVQDDDSARVAFSLVQPGSDPTLAAQIDSKELAAHLALLQQRKIAKPVLAPHRDARAEDLLVAVGLLDDRFAGRRSVAIRPSPSLPADTSVAAAREENRD